MAHINFMALHACQHVLFSLRWLSIQLYYTIDVLFFILSLHHEIRCRFIIKNLKNKNYEMVLEVKGFTDRL